MMTSSEIFSALLEYSQATHQHPDQVARVYAGLQDVEREFFEWAVEQRDNEKKGGDLNG